MTAHPTNASLPSGSRRGRPWLYASVAGAALIALGALTPACTTYVDPGFPVIDGVVEIQCRDDFDCTYDTYCLYDEVTRDSWCAYECIDDLDCPPAGCCLDTGFAAFCHPRRVCGGGPLPSDGGVTDGGDTDGGPDADAAPADMTGDAVPADMTGDAVPADMTGDAVPPDGGPADGGPQDGGADAATDAATDAAADATSDG